METVHDENWQMIVVQNQGQDFPQSNKICQLKIERHRLNQNQMEASEVC